MLIQNIQTACRGRNGNGSRCRHMVSGYGVCAQHDGTELVGPPGVILLKARINRKRVEALVKAGVREKKRDENSLDAKHSAEAQALERQPQAYRDKADSGVPVFGKDGAKGVAVDQVWVSLERVGYTATDAHFYRQDKDAQSGMATVTVEFMLGEHDEIDDKAAAACWACFCESYGFVHVWSNPPKLGIGPTCTVNCSHRQEVPPQARLVWDEGFWALEEV